MNQIVLMSIMVVAALLGSFGQLFLNKASVSFSFKTIWFNFNLFLFATFYGSAVLIQIGVYKAGGKMSLIYPVISLSYIFTAILAWYFLGEKLSIWTIIGTAIIISGVILISLGAVKTGT